MDRLKNHFLKWMSIHYHIRCQSWVTMKQVVLPHPNIYVICHCRYMYTAGKYTTTVVSAESEKGADSCSCPNLRQLWYVFILVRQSQILPNSTIFQLIVVCRKYMKGISITSSYETISVLLVPS